MRFFLPALVLVVTLTTFHGVLGGDFVTFDDRAHIADNPYFHPVTPEGVLRFWKEPALHLYMPVTYTFWALTAHFAARKDGTLSPFPFHLLGFLLHALNALLVFFLLRELLREELAACAGALIFALHPIQVEAVAWISAQKDLLATFFSLLCLLAYVRNRRGVAFLLFGLALLSKPAAVVLPALLFVVDRFLLSRPLRESRSLIAWCLPAVAILAVTRAAQPASLLARVPAPLDRLWIALDALFFYAAKIVFPFGLGLNYGRTPERVLAIPGLALFLLLPLVMGWLLYRYRCHHVAIAAVLWFLAAAAPTLGLLPFHYQVHSTVADRFLYLAFFGPALFAAYWLSIGKWPRFVAGGVALFALALLTHIQISYWRDDAAVTARMARVNPFLVAHSHR